MIIKVLPNNFFPKIEFETYKLLLEFFITHLIKNGKKEIARKIIYNTIKIIFEQTRANPYKILEKAVKVVSPAIKSKTTSTKKKKILIKPQALTKYDATVTAIKWIIYCAKKYSKKNIANALADQIIRASKDAGASCKERNIRYNQIEKLKLKLYWPLGVYKKNGVNAKNIFHKN